jgi:hypothetical protein
MPAESSPLPSDTSDRARDVCRELYEIEAIKQLKARYFRSVDTFDLDGWLDCFTDDCRLSFDADVRRRGQPPPQTFSFAGKQQLVDYWHSNTNRIESVHHGHMPEIQILSQSEAHGIWAMEDIVEFTDSVLHGFGHYHETYRKVGDAWRIATLRLTRTRLSQVPKTR